MWMVFKAAALAMGADFVVTNIIEGLDARGKVLILGTWLFYLTMTAFIKEGTACMQLKSKTCTKPSGT